MERPRQSTIAWATTIAGIYAYDLYCRKNEQMTDRAHEWSEHPAKKIALAIGTIAVGLHLNNVYNKMGVPHLDPLPYLIKSREFEDE